MIYINEISKFLIFSFILLMTFKNNNSNNHILQRNKYFPTNESNTINISQNLQNYTENDQKNNALNNSSLSENVTAGNKKIILIDKNDITNNKRILKDVLFINGCNINIIPHPYRYRVLHQMEQLNAGFIESDECFYENLDPLIALNYRVLIFFRCPWTEKIRDTI